MKHLLEERLTANFARETTKRCKLQTGGAWGLQGLRIWMCVLGCRSNLYDGEALSGELTARGAFLAGGPEGCQAAVVVSCSVTAAADKKCRQAVRRARRAVGPNGVVAACGCWAQGLDAGDARALGIDVLAGSRRKSALPDALEAALESGGFFDVRGKPEGWDFLTVSRPLLRTRAFLKVQEGCDHFCSYCVIPFLRGRPASRPLEDTLAEARRITESGCGEIVLTGVHLGIYGKDGAALAELVRRVSETPGLVRLRLGSLEPFSLTDNLLEALADSPLFCPHLHLPLQSGDDEVLARMRRGYTAEDFFQVCRRARKKLGGDLHISSDVLVGFPSESEEAFQNTLALMAGAGLGRVHVFPYSSRRGTEAAGFLGRLPPQTVSERAARAAALGKELLEHYAARFVGRNLPILAESAEDGVYSGYTRNFLFAFVRGIDGDALGREVGARMTGSFKGELVGEWIP
ncbi:MAG: MiaB/RimO family radical SAM methylthiotransferase [Synergistaceae bacterium]|nr:MiaB/RimO family radical SAM methylthiotransferase [Synergistaceae bacterium]